MKEGLTGEHEITILGFGEGDVDVQNAMRNKTEAANAALWPLQTSVLSQARDSCSPDFLPQYQVSGL